MIAPKVPNAAATGAPIAYGQPCGGNLTGTFPDCNASSSGGVLGVGGNVSITGTKTDGSDAISKVNVNDVFNVKAFGATATGFYGTDDASAIQAAINAACAVNTGGDGAGNFSSVGSQVFFPAGAYRVDTPVWVNCSGLSLVGAGRYSSVIVPRYDFGKTIALIGSQYQGLPLTTSLVSGAGSAADFTISTSRYWLNLREWDGLNSPMDTASGLNLNGLSALTVEAYVQQKATGDGRIVSSDSYPNTVASYVQAFELGVSGGNWAWQVQTSAGGCNALAASGPTLNTTYYVAGTYDGTTCRLYACTPGGSACAVLASATKSGTVVQDPTEDVTIGPALATSWPNGASISNAINGYIDSVRVSNNARWTGTIATVPNTKFSVDSNTLILTNFEKSTTTPFIRAYDYGGGAGSVGWLLPYDACRGPGAGCSGAGYLSTVSRNSIRDLAITGRGYHTDNSGIFIDSGHDDDIGPVQMSSMDIGLEVWNIAYENSFHDLTIGETTAGRYGIVNNSNDNQFRYTKVNGGWAGYVFGGSGSLYDPVFIQPGGKGSAYGLVLTPGNVSTVEVHSPWWDIENGGTGTFIAGILAEGITNLDIFGGQISTMTAAPAIWLDNGGRVTMTGGLLASGEGAPTQVVKITGSAAMSARLNNTVLSGWGSAPLSTTVGVVSMTPCTGKIVMVTGAGTFSNICVTTTSVCQARDMTTFANAVTLAAPVNGSVAFTGTGTDTVAVTCN
jgi:Pectate lyase superfamily protein/Concanavalin A-like lectin/glucanases superfamily